MKYHRIMRSWFPLAAEAAALAALAVTEAVIIEEEERFLSRPRRVARTRHRRSVQEVYDGLGPTYFRRAYRMEYATFWLLHDKLKESMEENLYRVRR